MPQRITSDSNAQFRPPDVSSPVPRSRSRVQGRRRLAMSSIQIVRSKLQRPRVSRDLIVPGDLLARLETAGSRPLTLLVAPAGYGKTALVAHWLEGRAGLAAWLSLDQTDSDPVVFATYLVAAVRTAIPEACAETWECLEAGRQESPAQLAGSLSNDFGVLPAPLVVVLDDYQRIDSPQTHALLDAILARPANALHLVVIARRDPPLSLGALRVRQAIDEIRWRDLQLGPRETALLLERCAGHTVDSPLLDRVQTCAEGWPVGVRLAALAARHGDDAGDAGFGGSSPQVWQYFVEEVMAGQSAVAREGLYRTSILERFCVPLCAALLGEVAAPAQCPGGHSFFDFVANGGLLCFPVGESGKWYRHHPLFREFLQRQLAVHSSPAEIAEMHRRAALWLETQGLLEEAIAHALAADGATIAGQLLARHRTPLMGRQQRQRLEHCLRILPADTVENSPLLLLLKAWLLHHQGRHVEIPTLLERIEALHERSVDADAAASAFLRGGVLALRSLQRYLEGSAELALTTAELALQHLPDDCPPARVIAQAVIAGARQMCGDLPGARQSIRDALARAPGPIDECQAPLVAALCFIDWMAADLSALQWTANQYCRIGEIASGDAGGLALGRYFHGLVYYQRNELALAEATLLPALAAQKAPRLGYRTEVSFVLAAVYQALGQADRARQIIDSVCAHLLRTGDGPALFRAQARQADLALRQGRLDEAREWARNFDPDPIHFGYRFSNVPQLTLARVWIAEGSGEDREQAGRLLQLLEGELAARCNVRFLIEVLALQAMLQQVQGETTAACEVLARAVALAQPGGFIRLFVDLGQELVPPLKRLHLARGSSARHVAHILSAFDDEWLVSAGRQQVGADLTRRELKILKLLAVRLSNVEISEELCISRATVKRHTQNIYRKLRASSRREAVVRARTLNILTDG